MYSDRFLQPWLEESLRNLPEISLFDAHTHVGENDPSGFSATLEELTESLGMAGARAAVFALKEPDGYSEPNLRMIAAAEESGDQLVAFARIDPAESPLEEAQGCIDAGAKGLKLHPASDEFEIDDRRLEGVFSLADALRLPVIIHSDPTDLGMGRKALELSERHPGARLILAHGALPDLAWLWQEVPNHPNLFFDTSWWSHSELTAMFALLPASQIIAASDLPYCTPVAGMFSALRCALQAGLDTAELRSVMGGQFERLIRREEAIPPGRPHPPRTLDVLAERAYAFLLTAIEPMQRGEEPEDALDLARAACRAGGSTATAALHAVEALLDLYEEEGRHLPRRNQFAPGWDLISVAAVIARTPDVPVRIPERTRSGVLG